MEVKYPNFDEQRFKGNVDSALKSVERILNVHRNPRLAEDVDHEYENKYDLANLLSNTWIIAQMNCMERMGLTAEILTGIDKSKSTTLRFQATTSCSFLRKITLQVPMQQTYETIEKTETAGSPFSGSTTKSTISRVINNINEYHWKVEVEWILALYSGANIDKKTVLQTRSSSAIVVIQSNEHSPLPERQEHDPCDVSLTWLLENIDNEALTAQFKIDTQHPDTKTPSRNRQILGAIDFTKGLTRWSKQVEYFFKVFVQQKILDKHNPAGPQTPKSKTVQLAQVSAVNVFNPIQPLMEEPSTEKEVQNDMSVDNKSVLSWNGNEGKTNDDDDNGDKPDDSGETPLLSANDMNKFLNEQIRSLEEKSERLRKVFPTSDMVKLVSSVEATVILICDHSKLLNGVYTDSIMYIERMLENQLTAAIGKRVTADDLDKFVKFHNAKFLDPTPTPFCRSIRRPEHYPDGILSIENAGDKKEPIETFAREVKINASLKIPLSAAATVELTGPTFLHGWLRHRFQHAHKSFEIIARARQFSSFMLVVGTMVGSDRLQPQDAIILQNKDEVIIPLLLDEIPSAKEFKDAIKSLSPEQQRFARAFRGMQLESSVLGVCVIQIKPQLEKLLRLPPDALTKEMKLTQYLMKMFVEYQVPSDLLSYDGGDSDSSVREKVANVKAHVQAVVDAIETTNMNDWEAGAMRATAAAHAAVEQGLGGFGGAPPPASGLFGAPAPAPAYSQFGASPAPAPAGGSLFGSPSPANASFSASPQAAAAPFDAPPPNAAVTPTGFSFGASPPAPSTMASPAPNASLFGTPAQAPVATALSARTGSATAESAEQVANEAPADGSNIDFEPSSGDVQDDTYDPSGEVSELLSRVKVDGVTDFTSLPKLLDSIIEHHNTDGALRSTVIKTGIVWNRLRQPNLLLPAARTSLNPQDIKSEKNKAFDLLDALSRSGSLPIACSELHVVVCLTHCFEKDVVGTVIQDNVNPIEKLEMSTLLLASTVHGVAPKDLIRGSKDINRLSASFPELLA